MKLVARLIKPSHKVIQWHLILSISMVLIGAIDTGLQSMMPALESAIESPLIE